MPSGGAGGGNTIIRVPNDRTRALRLGDEDALRRSPGIGSRTSPQFLARTGTAEDHFTAKGARDMHRMFPKTMPVVEEGSPASTVQARDLLGIAGELRIPRVVPVGDGKQLDAVNAGKPSAQLQQTGVKMAAMDEIPLRCDTNLKARRPTAAV